MSSSEMWDLSEAFEGYARRLSETYHEAAVFWMNRAEAAERKAEAMEELTPAEQRANVEGVVRASVNEWIEAHPRLYLHNHVDDLVDTLMEGIISPEPD